MRCYVHHEAESVGVCKCCLKGACAACAIEVTRGIACSEACRPIAEDIAQQQMASLRNVGLQRAQRFIQPLTAIFFVAVGAWNAWQYPNWAFGWFCLALGVALAAIMWRSSRRRVRT